MRVKNIRLPMAEKINIGEYESLELSIELNFELEQNEDFDKALIGIKKLLRKEFLKVAISRIKEQIRRRKHQNNDFFTLNKFLEHYSNEFISLNKCTKNNE